MKPYRSRDGFRVRDDVGDATFTRPESTVPAMIAAEDRTLASTLRKPVLGGAKEETMDEAEVGVCGEGDGGTGTFDGLVADAEEALCAIDCDRNW